MHAQGTSLVARGAELPNHARLLVFDDISEIVSAQRAQAWGEVARRLAHEIKNPLTPIQLSAERLELKLTGKLPDAEQAVLIKSVKTIVDQVDAMKRLVNEFRDYARLPAAAAAAGPECAGRRCAAPGAETAQVPVQAELDVPVRASWATRSNCARSSTTCCRTRKMPPCKRPSSEAAARTVVIATRWSESAQRVRLTVSVQARLSGVYPATRLRALCHHQGARHRPGPGGGQENRRRAWRAHRPGQPIEGEEMRARKCRYHSLLKRRWRSDNIAAPAARMHLHTWQTYW
jgi:hypothetical protein